MEVAVTYSHVPPIDGVGAGKNGGVGTLGVPGSIMGVVGGLTVTGVGGLPPPYDGLPPPEVGGEWEYPPCEGVCDGLDGVDGSCGGVPQFPPEGVDGVGVEW